MCAIVLINLFKEGHAMLLWQHFIIFIELFVILFIVIYIHLLSKNTREVSSSVKKNPFLYLLARERERERERERKQTDRQTEKERGREGNVIHS